MKHCTDTPSFDDGREELETVIPPPTMDGICPLPGAFDCGGSKEFLAVLDEIKSLHIAKSQDYGSEDDPLANIKSGADLLGIDPWKACLVRIADKVTRLRSFCHKGHVVFDGVEDTLADLCAYAAISLALYREQHRAKQG